MAGREPLGRPKHIHCRAERYDPAFHAAASGHKLPAYAGAETPAGYTLVKVSKVVEPEKVDDTQRAGLGNQLRQAVALGEFEAMVSSLRERVGVTMRKDALEKKSTSN